MWNLRHFEPCFLRLIGLLYSRVILILANGDDINLTLKAYDWDLPSYNNNNVTSP